VVGEVAPRRTDPVDLFVSYAGPDRAWAEWAASVLESAGYAVELDVWDWAVGSNATLRMSEALRRAGRVLALFSPAYFDRTRYTSDEWTTVLAQRPNQDGEHRLVPVRIAAVDPGEHEPILGPLLYRDLFGLSETRARAELLSAVGGQTGRGQGHPFPGDPTTDRIGGPRLPGTLPAVWNVRPRNPAFTGREAYLAALRLGLARADRMVVHALNGIGGVGKTSLAVEYAYLFAGDYDLVWWVDAERADLIGDQLARFGVATGWVDAASAVDAAWERVQAGLRGRSRWLVVFDNVESPADVHPWLPAGPGHVAITSRHQGFTGIANSVEVAVFTRSESIDLIRSHLPALPDAEAQLLAEAVGDLPLALAQAAGLLAETRMTVTEYVDELDARAREVLAEGRPFGYPVALASTVELAVERLGAQDQAAVDVLHLAAVLAAEPVPLDWFTASSHTLPAALGAVTAQAKAGRVLAWRRTLARIADLGLGTLTSDTLQVHRLTQAVLRDQRSSDHLEADHAAAVAMLAAAAPNDQGRDPVTWRTWAVVLPHLLVLDPAENSPGGIVIRATAVNAMWYLLWRGQYDVALPLVEHWRTTWGSQDGPENLQVQRAGNLLAAAYRSVGRLQEAHDLDADVLDRWRRVLGVDHSDTLDAARSLARDLAGLGRLGEAYNLDADVLERRRRLLGPDHPDTLISASNLAIDLRRLGRAQNAYDLDVNTLARRRRILGDDHPDTLISASNLGIALRQLGRPQEAYDLDLTTHATRQRVLGSDHPETLTSANNLAIGLSHLGRHEEAYDLNIRTHDVQRRVLGPDNPDTLSSVHYIAVDLNNLGRHHEAYALDKVTHDTLRRILGSDHLETLSSAHNLANDLCTLGRMQEGHDLLAHTVARRRRVLGEDHPDTRASISNLTDVMRRLGRPEGAVLQAPEAETETPAPEAEGSSSTILGDSPGREDTPPAAAQTGTS
jgi:hypothetical protein